MPVVMTFDEGLAGRVRDVLADRSDETEKRMFGGLGRSRTARVNGSMSSGPAVPQRR
jgi:hypothetical protein